MYKKLINFENKFTVSKAATIIGFLFLLSKFVGLYRQRLFASHFGAGDMLDIYLASFRIPDFIVNLLILGTLSVAFIPIFTELKLNSEKRANKIASTILNVTFLAVGLLSLILIIFASPVTHLIVPGFSGDKFNQTVNLTRILLLSPIIFTLSNVFTGILNAQKKFLIAGIAPILYNLGIIFGLLYFFPRWGIKGLAYGVILGALMHLGVQVPEAIRNGFRWQAVMDLKDEAFKKFIKLFIPRIFGIDISQFSLIIASIIGSFLAAGTISVYSLANDLQSTPVTVFAVSLAMAAFPLLSEQFAKKDDKAFIKTLSSTMVQILFFIIPITILFLLLRAHAVRLAYGAGKFNWQDTILTFNTLGIFTVSLFSQSLVPLLARAYYARKNTITPVTIGLASMGLNVAMSYLFGMRFGVTGLAAGFSAASIFNALILFLLIRRELAKNSGAKQALAEFDQQLMIDTLKIAIASIGLGAVCYGTLYTIEPLLNTRTFLGLFIQASVAALAGIVAFLAICQALRLENGKSVILVLRRKLRLS